MRIYWHLPGAARPPAAGGRARSRQEAELLRDLGRSSRLTKPSRESCCHTTRGRPGTRTEGLQPARAGECGRTSGFRAKSTPFPEAFCPAAGEHGRPSGPGPHRNLPREGRRQRGGKDPVSAQAGSALPRQSGLSPLRLFAGLLGGRRSPGSSRVRQEPRLLMDLFALPGAFLP